MCKCKDKLSSFEEYVICQKGTEPPFNNEFWDNKEAGDYYCKCCGEKLFSSEHKFDSNSGWPSFYLPVGEIKEIADFSGGMTRIEVKCANCNAHLGHSFGDGPAPTGIRYCINSVSLIFKTKYKRGKN